jgi:hypothetical protein
VWNGICIPILMAGYQTVLNVPPTNSVSTEQHQSLATVGWQFYNLLVRHEVQLVKDGVILGQVLVLAHALLLQVLAKDGAIDWVVFALLHGLTCSSPFLKNEQN